MPRVRKSITTLECCLILIMGFMKENKQKLNADRKRGTLIKKKLDSETKVKSFWMQLHSTRKSSLQFGSDLWSSVDPEFADGSSGREHT